MRTLEDLLADTARQRGSLLSASRARELGCDAIGGYRKVWDALNRYISETLEKRQTLGVTNFCKIGWKVEDGGGREARLRPHFQLTENFIRAYDAEARAHPVLPDRALAQVEDFNFSKAAIRFTQSLTKDNVFMGLRAIVQQIGEYVQGGKPFNLELEVGKLTCGSERDVRFDFVTDIYLGEGLSVPDGAVPPEAVTYKPSASFAPPSKDALSLSLRGTGAVKADSLGGFHDAEPFVIADSNRRGREIAGTPGATAAWHEVTQLPPGVSKLDVAHREAQERHIRDLEADAAAAIADRAGWEAQLKRCAEEEDTDGQWRKTILEDHKGHLRAQMRETEERRIRNDAFRVQQASQHNFPDFKEAPESAFMQYMDDRRRHLQEDLQQQAITKQRLQQQEKDLDRTLERNHLEATRMQMEELRRRAGAKRQAERDDLHRSWAKDTQLRSARKAIDNFHKAPQSKANGSDLYNTIRPSAAAGASGPRSMNVPASPAASGSLNGSMLDDSAYMLPSPRGLDPSGARTPRPPTGSVRRAPIGAAASLALHKKRMGETMRA
eukprot:TRINITY_DN15403_c0_g2_i1.p1 TRINITY_DN15403_c0_g2~~TRINITY_DN15403_c0_g2_i1.p1  ORF type:complete len:553 (+),score=113.75 TRINITY_DN15403_c0_g2_i1:83-1741(+)